MAKPVSKTLTVDTWRCCIYVWKKKKRKKKLTGPLLYVRICSGEGDGVDYPYCWLDALRLLLIPPYTFKGLSSMYLLQLLFYFYYIQFVTYSCAHCFYISPSLECGCSWYLFFSSMLCTWCGSYWLFLEWNKHSQSGERKLTVAWMKGSLQEPEFCQRHFPGQDRFLGWTQHWGSPLGLGQW